MKSESEFFLGEEKVAYTQLAIGNSSVWAEPNDKNRGLAV